MVLDLGLVLEGKDVQGELRLSLGLLLTRVIELFLLLGPVLLLMIK